MNPSLQYQTRSILSTNCSDLRTAIPEVLERARTAESSVQTHMKDRKALESSTSKSLAEMTLKLQEAQTLAGKSERESIVLREGFLQYKETHKREMSELRGELGRLVEGTRGDVEEAVSGGRAVRLMTHGLKEVDIIMQTTKRNQLVKALQARKSVSPCQRDDAAPILTSTTISASSAAVEELVRESRALQAESEQRLLLEVEELKRDLARDPSTRALEMAQ